MGNIILIVKNIDGGGIGYSDATVQPCYGGRGRRLVVVGSPRLEKL